MKKKITIIILLLITTFFNCINVFASTNTYDRSDMDNYGVKKKWQITNKNINNVLNTPAVDASEKIYDYSDVLTDEEEQKLKEKIDEFTEKYKMDLVIVTRKYDYPSSVSSYCYDDDSADKKEAEINEEFASDFYDYNDFGMIFENNSGILLFRNTAIDPCFNTMYYDMYTFGNAQLYFNKSRYDYILDGIYDNLHAENYYEGFSQYIDKVAYYIESGKPSDLEGYTVDENGYLQAPPRTYHIPFGTAIGGGLLISSIIVGILISKNRMVKKASRAEEYLDNSSYKLTNKQDIFIKSRTTHYTETHTTGSSGGGGGHSSHSGSSGGGHSSGGGRHG